MRSSVGAKKGQDIETHDSCFGITYRQDQEIARAYVRRLIEQGVYPECLYPDDIALMTAKGLIP
jgi:hypothetical protein